MPCTQQISTFMKMFFHYGETGRANVFNNNFSVELEMILATIVFAFCAVLLVSIQTHRIFRSFATFFSLIVWSCSLPIAAASTCLIVLCVAYIRVPIVLH